MVGHAEWVRFARVPRLPAAGEVVHATDTWEETGGGGAVAAVQLARLAGEASFYTALGKDAAAASIAGELAREGVRVYAAEREGPHRRVVCHLDAQGERAMTVLAPRIGPDHFDRLPWKGLVQADAAYFTQGDANALVAARRARVLVATARAGEPLLTAGVRLDVLVRSGADASERLDPGRLDPPPRFVVTTLGARGGRWEGADGATGGWDPAPLPGPVVDAYGCGDAFHAGLTYALGNRDELDAALALGARCGAACLTGRGPFTGLVRA